ncbi:hypothetical protein C8F04DRAFT_1178631 [Mycena alexandri]|uniref:CxC2-like cysteine cluster KDZ transposase-associated domain-containing protein n=1 Tax=Mycena alexandri TaxID=1745969 RepID=A0AAD6XBS4_9AGAR|nr:hypothetical protein C8F04DRAFT_1178631 [Mycena alexandri]
MAASTSSNWAPNRLQRDNSSFYEYETRPADLSRDRGFFQSHDGRRGFQSAHNIGAKRRRVCPSDLVDSLRDWVPLPDEANGELDADETSADAGDKRKHYLSSDEPMVPWRALKQFFLDELLRNDGLGDALDEKTCSCCKTPLHETVTSFSLSRLWGLCTMSHLPLHRLKEWNGMFWASTTLKKLGFVYQLGHGGYTCPHPAPTPHDMVVMDTEAIHTVSYRYCRCDKADHANNLQQLLRNEWYPATTVDPATCATFRVIETFRILNVVGNINVHNFVGAMERQTDPSQVEKVPDRYKSFGLMARQYSFAKRTKRAGRGHDPAVRMQSSIWFLYMLILAMDANFRLKNRLRANKRDDPPLGDGWGYIVEEGPYKEHLHGYVAEKDVSTCIAFAALLQKDTRLTTGLRSSGVGGVVCAWHEVVRPQGIGDLQKGERYANMDYILMSAILGITALYLAISLTLRDCAEMPITKQRAAETFAPVPEGLEPNKGAERGWEERMRGRIDRLIAGKEVSD